tara:strand:+ start:603 stop:938 length:336 start_codon:yes stop_codon:yes gene_type:complete
MKNYKALKSKSKVAVKKVKVVDQEAVKEITDEKGNIVRQAAAEQSHEELQVVSKVFDSATGEAMADRVESMSVSNLEDMIASLKSQKTSEAKRIDDEVADLEELVADLKKL